MTQTHFNAKKISVQVVNAFVKNDQGGNPAGVVLDADRLSDQEKQSVAQQVGLSETAFVSQSRSEGFKLDFFTPNRQIAHCGHATIATFSYLASLGRVSDGETSKETVDGARKIILDQGMAYMEQLAPKYQTASEWQEKGVSLSDVLDSLSLDQADLETKAAPLLVNTGNNFIVLGVKDQEVLRNLVPNLEKISEISERLDLIGYYVFTLDTLQSDMNATTRMFAPRYDIAEEAATGMAAGPLACVLWDHVGMKKQTMLIGQGDFMPKPSPSLITVNLDIQDGEIQGLLAGGKGQVMQNMEVAI